MKIGIIGAMKSEIKPLLDFYKDYKEVIVGKQIFYEINYNGLELVVVESKIGKVAAAMSATILITKFNSSKIFFSGVAGGLDESLEIGDLILAKSLCHHDVDITAFGHPKGHIPEVGVFIKTSNELRNLALDVAKKNNIKVKEGIVATGDQFVSNSETKKNIVKNFNASALEMEGVAVAQVAQELEVPCLILRSISDKANGDAPSNFDEFVEIAAKNSSSFIIKIIDTFL